MIQTSILERESRIMDQIKEKSTSRIQKHSLNTKINEQKESPNQNSHQGSILDENQEHPL